MSAVNKTPLMIVIWLCLWLPAAAQTIPPLERTVAISFDHEKLDKALLRLSKEARFTFSFNPAILDAQRELTASFTGKTVREILESIFKGSIQYKEKGNYIILTKPAPAPIKTSSAPVIVPLTLSGYVLHASTGDKLAEVSIYDKESLTAVITNAYGFFKITLSQPADLNRLTFSKRKFVDTVYTLTTESAGFVTIMLKPEVTVVPPAKISEAGEIQTSLDSTSVSPSDTVPPVQSVVNDPVTVAPPESKVNEGKVNVENVKDTLYRPFQASFIPFVGTNKFLSGNVINGISFNMLGGYSMGTRYFEFGGLFNVNRGDAGRAQFGGLFNMVGGRFTGVQAGGLFNVTRRGFSGTQLAGLANVSTAKSGGTQLAGLINVQHGNLKGAQLAGLVNVATKKISGAQIAGLVNYGHNVKGIQIGFINVADSLRGVPIGFISYVRHGYHKLEFSADEVFDMNMAFRTGTHKFYNILLVGMNPEPDENKETLWTFGYGFGTAPKLTRWLYLNIDVTAQQINHDSFTEKINLLNKAYVGFEVQAFKKMGLAFGITLNGLLRDRTYTEYGEIFNRYNPKIINTHHYNNDIDLTMWWGAKVAVRFF